MADNWYKIHQIFVKLKNSLYHFASDFSRKINFGIYLHRFAKIATVTILKPPLDLSTIKGVQDQI